MNKRTYACLLGFCALATPLWANTTPTDSSRVINLEEVYVVASPKQNTQLRKQPLSSTLLSGEQLEDLQANSIKGVSGLAPNFYMPDYGSRYTSAVYIRGIGSRMNTPAVGLYVDNIAYVDKSAYDFAFNDIERVDVLRGPQATLYGRNTMGGLVRVFTSNPLRHFGTNISLGASTRNGGRKMNFTTFLHPCNNLGISVSGYYEGEDGFFKNSANNKHADFSDNGGGKLRAVYQANDNLKFDFTASYEQNYEGACPYIYEGAANGPETMPEALGQLAQNRPSTYRRGMLNTGLNVEWRAENFKLNSVTAYQHLQDRIFIDQDFTTADIFSLNQRQRINTFSQELSLTSKPGHAWQSTSGVYAMMQVTNTSCPVVFYEEGINFLNSMFAKVLPQRPPMVLAFTDAQLPFMADMRTPTANAAAFHQSTYKFDCGLSVSAGLRLDYDLQRLELNSGLNAPANFTFTTMGRPIPFTSSPTLSGDIHKHTWQLLPKIALQYDFKDRLGNVYASASKGYRSGGYNVQAYSDLSQAMLQRDMMLQVYETSKQMMVGMGMPEAMVEQNLSGLTTNIPAEPLAEDLYYKPEQTWSYEVGTHLNLCNGALAIDLSAFLMDTKDQQVAEFAESGMGRNVKNSGKSRSVGGELGVFTKWLNNRLAVNLNYGFTHATFKANDNYVPYVPKHTISAVADFRQPLNNDILKAVTVGANYYGVGNIKWNEANTFEQHYYSTLGAHLNFEFAHDISLDLWGKNLTKAEYDTFRFDSMNRRYAQRGIPCHFGANLKLKF